MSTAKNSRRTFLIGVIFVFTLLLSACYRPAATPNYFATNAAIYAINMATQMYAMSQPTALPATKIAATATSTVENTPTAENTKASTSTPTAKPTAKPMSEDKLMGIQQAFSGLYITASSNTAGSGLTQETGGTDQTQIWRFVSQAGESEGTYAIKTYDSSLCLENTGDIIVLNTCDGSKVQTWMTVPCLNYFGRYMCEKTSGSSVYLQSLEPLESNEYTKGFSVPFTGKVMGLQGCDAFTGAEYPELTQCNTPGWQINSQGVTGGSDLLWYLIPRD